MSEEQGPRSAELRAKKDRSLRPGIFATKKGTPWEEAKSQIFYLHQLLSKPKVCRLYIQPLKEKSLLSGHV